MTAAAYILNIARCNESFILLYRNNIFVTTDGISRGRTNAYIDEGEVTDKLFSFCNGLLGRLKGGTAQVNVFISLIFSGMSGSAIADASGIGLMEIEQMKKEGYDAEFSCAVTAASATVGPIFPPSIPMVIYAMLSGASVGKLFAGGVNPVGLVIAFILLAALVFQLFRPYKEADRLTVQ